MNSIQASTAISGRIAEPVRCLQTTQEFSRLKLLAVISAVTIGAKIVQAQSTLNSNVHAESNHLNGSDVQKNHARKLLISVNGRDLGPGIYGVIGGACFMVLAMTLACLYMKYSPITDTLYPPSTNVPNAPIRPYRQDHSSESVSHSDNIPSNSFGSFDSNAS